MIQEWYCERCNVLGSVVMRKHVDGLGGFRKVVESHTQVSSKCLDSSKIRVRALNCSQREWDRVTRRKKNKAKEKAADGLLRAVGVWVRAHGGSALVAGGIGIMHPEPFGPKYNFRVVINVTGRMPGEKEKS